jgi:hypothetical protein
LEELMNVKQRLELRMRHHHTEFLDRREYRERLAAAFQVTRVVLRETFNRLCRGAV